MVIPVYNHSKTVTLELSEHNMLVLQVGYMNVTLNPTASSTQDQWNTSINSVEPKWNGDFIWECTVFSLCVNAPVFRSCLCQDDYANAPLELLNLGRTLLHAYNYKYSIHVRIQTHCTHLKTDGLGSVEEDFQKAREHSTVFPVRQWYTMSCTITVLHACYAYTNASTHTCTLYYQHTGTNFNFFPCQVVGVQSEVALM